MHMCIAFFVYLHLPASALPALRAQTRGFASAHSFFDPHTHVCGLHCQQRARYTHLSEKKSTFMHIFVCQCLLMS